MVTRTVMVVLSFPGFVLLVTRFSSGPLALLESSTNFVLLSLC